MDTQFNFRSAFNGFNREDVVHYIEFLNNTHGTELNQLRSELDALRNQPAPVPAPIAAPDEDNEAVIEEQAARIRELFDRCKTLENELNAANEEKKQLQTQLESNQVQQTSYRSRMEEELEAYRRAERTERLARERAEQLYRQANGALADATAKVDNAAIQIGGLSDRVLAQLTELQTAVTGSKQALRDAAATMYTIRPDVGKP